MRDSDRIEQESPTTPSPTCREGISSDLPRSDQRNNPGAESPPHGRCRRLPSEGGTYVADVCLVPVLAILALPALAQAQFEAGNWELKFAGERTNAQDLGASGCADALGYFVSKEQVILVGKRQQQLLDMLLPIILDLVSEGDLPPPPRQFTVTGTIVYGDGRTASAPVVVTHDM